MISNAQLAEDLFWLGSGTKDASIVSWLMRWEDRGGWKGWLVGHYVRYSWSFPSWCTCRQKIMKVNLRRLGLNMCHLENVSSLLPTPLLRFWEGRVAGARVRSRTCRVEKNPSLFHVLPLWRPSWPHAIEPTRPQGLVDLAAYRWFLSSWSAASCSGWTWCCAGWLQSLSMGLDFSSQTSHSWGSGWWTLERGRKVDCLGVPPDRAQSCRSSLPASSCTSRPSPPGPCGGDLGPASAGVDSSQWVLRGSTVRSLLALDQQASPKVFDLPAGGCVESRRSFCQAHTCPWDKKYRKQRRTGTYLGTVS